MAYVPKREPCVQCNNPVFFAERLVIEDQLYHRTCFKCARCSNVLTLGNFYQTENDSEYVCEECPDEERTRSTKNGENRLSMAQRIALFEKETSNVLKKSLSDEEKSKSLSRQLPTTSPSAPGLSKFLSTQIASDKAESDDDEDEKTVNSLSSQSDSEDDRKPSLISESDAIKTPTKEVILHSENAQPQEHKTVESQIFDTTTSNTYDINDLSNMPDDIEIEFEKLAEEAVKSPSAPVVITQKPQITISEVQTSKIETKTVEEETKIEKEEKVLNPLNSTAEASKDEYPDDLNPFGDEDEKEEIKVTVKKESLNPFGSCSEDEDDVKEVKKSINTGTLPKPPRPPPPKTSPKPVSTNPFGSDDDEEEQDMSNKSTSFVGVKTPVPTPRRPL